MDVLPTMARTRVERAPSGQGWLHYRLLVEGVPIHRADVQQFKESSICV
jgi:hypothetical protein